MHDDGMTTAPRGGEARPLLLTGRNIGLALLCAEDVPAIARWNQDLDLTARLGTPGEADSLEVRREAYESNARVRPDSAEFAIILRGAGHLIGWGGLFDITRALTGTMFVAIGEVGQRGKGHGIEAVRLICEYGFFFRSLHSIKVEVHAYNVPALRTYERLGFKPAGRLRGTNLLNNRRYDEVIMDLLRDELELQHVSSWQTLEIGEADHARRPT